MESLLSQVSPAHIFRDLPIEVFGELRMVMQHPAADVNQVISALSEVEPLRVTKVEALPAKSAPLLIDAAHPEPVQK